MPSSSLPGNPGSDADPPTGRSAAVRTLTRDRPVPTASRAGWFPALLRRLHFYAGILIGPFILIAALSGAMYALSPELEKVVYADELSASSTGPALPLADQVEAANAYIGVGETISAVRPAPEPGTTTRVMYEDPSLGEGETRAVFVDPTTAEVKGDLTVYGTSGALPMRTWIDQLHRSLNLGDVGRLYSELAASWLGIVAAAGLCLWVIRARKARRVTELLRPTRTRRGLRRTFSWHASVGVWAAIGMLFLSATGITWSQLGGENVAQLRAALNWETPSISTELDDGSGSGGAGPAGGSAGGEHAGHDMGGTGASAPADGPNPADFDMMLGMAQSVNVNTGLVEIRPPAEAGSAWVVQEIQRSFPTEVDAVAFDPVTMRVSDRVDFADFGLAAKLSRWGIDLHMGSMFGLPNQIALFVLAVGIAAMVVWGYVMWWQRRPKHDPSRRFGIAPARGVLLRTPWWATAAVVLVAVGVGLFLPLVGISLVAFLVLDVLLWLRAKRRHRL